MWSTAAGMLLLVAACGRLGFESQQANNDAVIDGLAIDSDTARANRAFVSQGQYRGDFGGTAGADALCQAEAVAANLDGEFLALLKASTRPDPAQPFANSRGWQLPSGNWVADLPSQLGDGAFFQPIREHANGTFVNSEIDSYRVWTGDVVGNCNDWTNKAANGDQTWLAHWRRLSDGEYPCDMPLRLYCFERGKQFAFSPVAIVHKRIFLSTTTFTPGASSGPDVLCQSEATSALLPGSYQAVLPSVGVAALDKLPNGRTTVYQRIDGFVVGVLGSSATQRTYITVTADGSMPAGENEVWTGGDPTIVQTNTCTNWRANAGSAESGPAFAWPGFAGVTKPCTTPLHLYCAEQ